MRLVLFSILNLFLSLSHSAGVHIKKMSSQEIVQHEILSEVSNSTSNSNNQISSLNGANLEATYDANATSLADFAQQTLIDVNSQPLIQNIIDNHQLISHPLNDTTTTATSNSVALPSDDQQQQPATTENTTNVLDPNSPIITEFYERFPMGRMFQSLEALRTETYEYGRKHNVALTTSKSDKTKIYLICKHGGQYRKNVKKSQKAAAAAANRVIKARARRSQKTGCACMIYARCCRGSFWIIRKSIGEHNHPIANDPSAYAMYRSLSPEHLITVHRLLREHVSVSLIIKSLKASGVSNILAKDIENIQQDMKRRDVLELPQQQQPLSIMPSESSTTTSTSLVAEPSSSSVVAIHPIPATHLLEYQHDTATPSALIAPSSDEIKLSPTESHIIHE